MIDQGIGDRVGDGVGPRVILGENRDIPGELKAVTRQRVPMCLELRGRKENTGDGEVLFHAVIVGGHALRRGPQHELDDAGDPLMARRRLVPLVGEDGNATGEGLRMDDPEVESIDRDGVGGTAQLTLHWSSRRPYDAEEAQKMVEFTLNFIEK